jgi:hypothetical protein
MKAGKRETKKKYDKPMLRVVSIAEGIQTLGIGCKTATSANPGAVPCYSVPCSQRGS